MYTKLDKSMMPTLIAALVGAEKTVLLDRWIPGMKNVRGLGGRFAPDPRSRMGLDSPRARGNRNYAAIGKVAAGVVLVIGLVIAVQNVLSNPGDRSARTVSMQAVRGRSAVRSGQGMGQG